MTTLAPSIPILTGGYNTAAFESAVSFIVSCDDDWANSCLATATIAPCQCENFQAYISAEYSCLAQGNNIAGTSLWDVDATWIAEESSIYSTICLNAVTVAPVGGIGRTTAIPHITTKAAGSLNTPTVTPAPIYASVTTVTSLNSTATYTPLPTWNGAGHLLADYCGTPDFSLFQNGATALWVPIVGCNNDKPDCCPYGSVYNPNLPSTSPTGTLFTTSITVNVGPSGQVSVPTSIPTADLANELVTLGACPGDYQIISGGCCPTGYGLWNADLGGGQTPCFSTLAAITTAPPILVAAMNVAMSKPTSAVINVVYAVHYPLKRSSLSTGAKIGIGVGSGVGALCLIALILIGSILLFKKRPNKQAATAQQLLAVQQSAPMTAAPGGFNEKDAALATAMANPVDQNSWNKSSQSMPVYPAYQQASPQTYQQVSPQQYQQAPPNTYQQPMYPQQAGQPMPRVYPAVSPPPGAVQGQYQQVPEVNPEVIPAPVRSVSPVQTAQELHDPNWAGRHELQGQ